jgi:hypothetical protein
MARPVTPPVSDHVPEQANVPTTLPPAPPAPPTPPVVTSPTLPDGALGHATLPDWFIPG